MHQLEAPFEVLELPEAHPLAALGPRLAQPRQQPAGADLAPGLALGREGRRVAPLAGELAQAVAVLRLDVARDQARADLRMVGRGGELGPSFDVQVRLSAPDGSPLPTQTWNTMRPSGFLDDRVEADAEEGEPEGEGEG